MKKLLVLLPLLLTACSSVQLKKVEPRHDAPVIRYQPPAEEEPKVDMSFFEPVKLDGTVGAFRCFREGDVEGQLVRADVVRNLDIGQVATIYVVHEGRHLGIEGILAGVTEENELVITVLQGFSKEGAIVADFAIKRDIIEYVVISFKLPEEK